MPISWRTLHARDGLTKTKRVFWFICLYEGVLYAPTLRRGHGRQR